MHKFLTLLWIAASVNAAEPMTNSFDTYEGRFVADDEKTRINIRGLPPIDLWTYRKGSGPYDGIAVGFSDDQGRVLRGPTPNEKGVQPIYSGYIVSVNSNNTADIFITYSVQGNGGIKEVEKYNFDGTNLVLQSKT